MSRPLFSIITVTLNAESAVRATLDSLARQTCQDYELIVIDGGSTDGTLEVVQSAQVRLSVVVSEPDSGVYNAMNKGIAGASGRYIHFLNAGDLFIQDRVLTLVKERLESMADNPPDIFVGSGVRFSKKDGHLIYLNYDGVSFDKSFFKQRTINHQCVFAKRDLYKQLNFDERYAVVADYVWLIEMILERGVSVHYQNLGIIRYLHEGASLYGVERLQEEKQRVIDLYQLADDEQSPLNEAEDALSEAPSSLNTARKTWLKRLIARF